MFSRSLNVFILDESTTPFILVTILYFLLRLAP
nr:MAG TPA: hypothetical protein [Caudoviricetes sp.]